jgi:hypothetical protein
MKITKGIQEKLEAALKALDYKVRYEKGSFKSGYCLIEDQRVVVVNKFYPLESKVATLAEILRDIHPALAQDDPALAKLVQQLTTEPAP